MQTRAYIMIPVMRSVTADSGPQAEQDTDSCDTIPDLPPPMHNYGRPTTQARANQGRTNS